MFYVYVQFPSNCQAMRYERIHRDTAIVVSSYEEHGQVLVSDLMQQRNL